MKKGFYVLLILFTLILSGCSGGGEKHTEGVSSDGHYYLGEKDAKVLIEEFSDFQCPYCALHVRETFPKIKKKYIDTGLVRYQFVNVPLRSIHPAAQKAAEAALCAGRQGNFWGMHDKLFETQREWGFASDPVPLFEQYASQMKLDIASFRKCLKEGETAYQIEDDLAEAMEKGVRGTPTFFINGRKLEGAYPFEAFVEIIEEELKK